MANAHEDGGANNRGKILNNNIWLLRFSSRSHFRLDQELQADMARQRRVLSNIALIEPRDREERDHGLRIPKPTPDERSSQQTRPQEFLTSKEPNYEPQTWTPKTRSR